MRKRFAIILLCAVVAQQGFAAITGSIKGKITDESQLSLAGANVFIESLNLGTASDQNGEFYLSRVPVGTYELTISFIGYKTLKQDVNIEANKMAQVDIGLEPGVITTDKVLVLGERLKGQAKALNQQKNSETITNVVSSDQIGRFPDANVGDAVKRIPSIHVNYDQGEARFVNIRGTEPRLNSVTINGDRIPSAEGEVRSVQVDLIPSDMIQTIEVNKALTADMDADAIGGAINLVTRQAPNALRVSGTVGSGYNFLSGKPQTIGSVILGKRFLDNRLGVVVSASSFNHNLGSHNVEGAWDFDDDGNAFVDEWQVRTYSIRRLRQSIAANFDYVISPSHTLTLNTMLNHRNDWENRYRIVYKDLGDDLSNGISPDATIRRQVKGGINDDANEAARLEDQRVTSTSLKGEHIFGDLNMDWSLAYAKASEERPHERYIQWAVKHVEIQQDLADLSEPQFTVLNEVLSPSNYKLDELTEEYQYTDEKDLNGKMDFDFPFIKDGKYKNNIQFGVKYKEKEKERNNAEFYEYSPIQDGDLETMDQTRLKDVTEDDFLAGDYEAGYFTSEKYLGDLDLKDNNRFEEEDKPDEYASDNYEATEAVTAGYLMLKQNLGEKWSVNAGLRLEKTDIDYTGNEFIEEDEEGNENVIVPVTGKDDYTNVLPSLHVTYRQDKNTVFRFAWTNTIARPNYYDLVPYRAISGYDDETGIFEELAVGNPFLKPTQSMNLDLMAEKYLESIGIMSAGVFYKDITDYIYVQNINDYKEGGRTYEDYFIPQNGAKATLYGVELAIQRQLTFLPGFLSNFGIYANYTYTYSEADNPVLNEQVEGDETIALPGTAPHTLNAALNYNSRKLTLGLSFNFTDAYLDPDEMDLTPGLERYYDKVTYLDLTGSYAITKQLRFFFEANNLLNQPLRYYAGKSDRTYQAEYYDRRFSTGLKFDL